MWSMWKRRKGKVEKVEKVGKSDPVEGLSLYGYPGCPFCRRVFDAADSLGLEIPLRDTQLDADHHREMVEAMGRATVPVLLIEGEAGEVKWLPESADIVRYLNERFGDDG
jgi:glutathione S-transferase